MSSGWIKLSRKILEDPLFDDPIMLGIFTRLCLMAQHKPFNSLDTHELYTKVRHLSSKLDISIDTVRIHIRRATLGSTLTTTQRPRGMVVKILKYLDNLEQEPMTRNADTNAPTNAHATLYNKTETEKKNIHTSPSAPRGCGLAVLWNAHCGRCRKVQSPSQLSVTRARRANAVWQAKPDEVYWIEVIKRIAASDFCTGSGPRGWRANFEFLIRDNTHERVMDGEFGGSDSPTAAPPGEIYL